jgi:hypothetical protein
MFAGAEVALTLQDLIATALFGFTIWAVLTIREHRINPDSKIIYPPKSKSHYKKTTNKRNSQ